MFQLQSDGGLRREVAADERGEKGASWFKKASATSEKATNGKYSRPSAIKETSQVYSIFLFFFIFIQNRNWFNVDLSDLL